MHIDLGERHPDATLLERAPDGLSEHGSVRSEIPRIVNPDGHFIADAGLSEVGEKDQRILDLAPDGDPTGGAIERLADGTHVALVADAHGDADSTESIEKREASDRRLYERRVGNDE